MRLSTMKMICRFFLIILPISLYAGMLQAAQDIPDKSGFSGFVLLGAGHLDLKSNTVAGNEAMEVGSPIVDSIFSPPESSDDVHPVLTGEVRYTFEGSKSQAFIGNSISDLMQLDVTQRLGIRRKNDSAGIFGLAYVFSSFPPEVWEDPFLTGVPRTETDRDSEGIRLEWDNIVGRKFDLDVTYRDIDVDVERSGEALGLSAADRALLDRDGDQFSIVVDYTWHVSPGHIVQPQIGYMDDDRNGDAVSSDGYWAQLTYIYLKERWTVATNLLLRKADYDAVNLVYGMRQDSDQFLVGTVVSYDLNFPGKRWSANGFLTYAESDSDIDFYDTEVVSVILALGYRF